MDPTTWEAALDENNGDYAYASDGGMISREGDGTYTVRNGDLQAAIDGQWGDVERAGLNREEIPDALQALNMAPQGWSYE